MPVRLTDNAMGSAMPDDYDPVEDPSYLYELDQDGNKVSLRQFRGEKNVVLYFYPKAMTPG